MSATSPNAVALAGVHRWRRWHAALRIATWLVFALGSLVLLAWLTLHWGILPRLDEWRPQIEARLSRALGLQVQIGRIDVRSSGWVPAFKLHEVVLRDARGVEALRLPQVAASLSVPALLSLRLGFDQVLLEGPSLEVRRDAKGHLRVAGLDMDGEALGSEGELADWFFEQSEFAIRGGSVRWVDELRAAPALELSDVQLVLRNRLHRHEVRLDATPPAAWGQRFKLVAQARQPLLARAGDWQRWRGSAYADFPQVLVQQLRRQVDLPFELNRGEGALRAWVDFNHGLPQGGTLDVALRDVSLRLGPQLQPLRLAQVGGRVALERSAEGVQIRASGLEFKTVQGKSWPATQLGLSWRQQQVLSVAQLSQAAALRPITGGEFSADRVDLALLAELAEHLPLGAELRRLLAELKPRGAVSALTAAWDGAIDAPEHYRVQAQVRGMALAAAQSPVPEGIGRPGWRGADLSFSATESGGQAKLTLNGGQLDLPGVFEQPLLPLRRLGAQLNWRLVPLAKGPPRVELTVASARFENDDVQGSFEARWQTGESEGVGKGARLPGRLEMSGQLTQGLATEIARYLPLGIPSVARDYVRRAVQGGKVTLADFRLRGDLWDFPFLHTSDGEFHVEVKVQDVSLSPVPTQNISGTELASPSLSPAAAQPRWPVLSNFDAELIFDRTTLQVRQGRGRLWGLDISGVQGGISNLADDATLELSGLVCGPASDLLRYVNVTPVADWTQGALARASVEGPAEMNLTLKLPLARLEQSTVLGSVQLAGGDLRIRPELPLLGAARGQLDFTQAGFSVKGTAQSHGGQAHLQGGTQPDGSLRFTALGTATAEALRHSTDIGPAAHWAERASGQAPYRLQLDIVRGRPELLVTSPLTGLAIDLPAPLQKPADVAWPLRVHWRAVPGPMAGLSPNSAGSTSDLANNATSSASPDVAHDLLRIDLGSALSAQYLREVRPAETRVLLGAVAVNATLPEMAPGVRAVLDLTQANADAWWALLPWLDGTAAEQASPGAAGPQRSAYLPQAIALKAQSLTLAGRRLSRLTLALDRQIGPAPVWSALVDADELSGEISFTEALGATDAGRVRARLARWSLPQAEADAVAGWLERAPGGVPANFPAVDLEVEDFELHGRKLGRLTLQAINRSRSGVASAREWRVNRLSLGRPEAELVASGQWAPALGNAAQRRMALDFELRIADAGALLQSLGFGAVIRGGKGLLKGQVSWAGSPLGLHLPTLGGQMNLALEAGQFLKVDPGAGRLLGVLSMQALPRRLALDFRDVFQEGFAFDNITGDVQLEPSLARTNNLRMRGVQAAVLMEGSADLERETQDLSVLVVPEINAGTASLVYAVINPAVGLGTFLGQWLLRGTLAEAGTREFRVSGPWADPAVTPVERRAGAETAASAAGSLAASAASAVASAAASAATSAATSASTTESASPAKSSAVATPVTTRAP